MKNGKVAVDRLKTKLGNVGDLELKGFYNMDGALDYQGTLLLSREWTRGIMSQGSLLGGLAGLLGDQSVERLKLPLVITGTVDKPAVNLDYSALGQNVQDNLGRKAEDVLNNLIKKKK